MRGDYVEVIYKKGPETGTVTVVARNAGGSVDVTEPREKDPFVEIKELNQVKQPIQTVRVAKGEVIALIEGHETIASKK